ncbi:MAG: CoA transferase [Chloroflexota bacterium]|nr:CoA transferase [Chloroflexota bacterium]
MSTEEKGVFAGVKVLALTWVMVGPLTLRYLADHGAEVIKVESISRPEVFRLDPPFKDNIKGINRSGTLTNFNCNYYSMGLNMNLPRGREVMKKLISRADILAESLSPGTLKKWGFGYEQVKEINPSIIMASFSMQGQTGPRSTLPGFGVHLVGLSGHGYLTGYPDRPPCLVYSAYTDSIVPRYGAAALIAALDYRYKTGKGQYLDFSQFETGLQFMTPVLLDQSVNGRIWERMGNRYAYAAPHNAYRCKGNDRWCVVSILNETEWEVFCVIAGGKMPCLKDPKFATFLGRKQNEEELDKLMESWTLNFTPEQTMAKLQAAGLPAAIVQNARDLFSDAQLCARNHYWVLDHPEIGPHTVDSLGFKLSKTPSYVNKGAPCLGEHTEYICKDILELSDEDFIELMNAGVLQ